MSATNRGAKRSERDFYPTPETAFRPMLARLPRGDGGGGITYWEPACGDGRLIKWLRQTGRTAAGTDLARGHDFLRSRKRRQFIITNPPFSIGLQFLQKSLELAPEVLLLLPLNFLGASYRKEFLSTHEPAALFVITPRPSFGLNKHGRKGTDSNEYAWFYWGRRWQGVHHL